MRLNFAKLPVPISAHLLLGQTFTALIRLTIIFAPFFALMSGGHSPKVEAGISIIERTGRNIISGSVSSFPPGNPNTARNSYDVTEFAPAGLGSFLLSTSPPAGTTTVSGASAIANAKLDATIALNPLTETLLVTSTASTPVSVSGTHTAELIGNASAGAGTQYSLRFATNIAYDYEIGYAFSPALQGATNQQALAFGGVAFRGPSVNFLRERVLFENTFGTQPDNDSLVGTIFPGEYVFSTRSNAGLRDIDGTSVNAACNFVLRLTPALPEIRWVNAADGFFQTGGNWSTGSPPTLGENALINRPGSYEITLAGNAEHKRLRATGNGANVTLDLDGHRYRLDELRLGDLSGNFSFSLSDSSGIAAAPPDHDGPWPTPGIGRAEFTVLRTVGTGSTDITAKTITQSGLIDDSHTVSVKGDGDWTVEHLTVGDEDPASLMVSGGGKVNSRFPIIGKRVRGILSSTRGKLTVAGEGDLVSKFDAIQMIVGDDGKGELEVKNGGEVSAAEIKVGNTSNGVGVVTVDGLTAKLRQNDTLDDLVIGAQGKGTLNILNEAEVNVRGILKIGAGAGGSGDGVVNVASEAFFVAKNLAVGNEGKGALSVLDGGLAQTGRTLIGPQGKVTIGDEGNFLVDTVLTVNGELSVNTTAATRVGPGFGATVGELAIVPGGTLRGSGIIRANVDFAGGSPQFTGSRLAPANSTGTLTIEGDVVQEAGSAMEIEIGGTAAGQSDVLAVTGNATLGGDVFLKFTNGFAPRQGDQFEFLDVGGTLSGSFANVHLRNLAPGFQFDLSRAGGGMTMVALNDGVFMLPQSSAWNVDASGNWSSVANWTDSDPNHAGATAVLGSKITAPRTVTIDAPTAVGRIDFANANAYTIDGENALTLDAATGDAQINVTSGSHTISAPVSLADNTVITVAPAASNLAIGGALSASEVNLTKVGAGRLTLANIDAGGLTIGEGTVAMAPHAASSEPSTAVLSTLSIAGGAAPTAKLDLTNNAGIIDYADTSPVATVRQQLLAGRGGSGLGAAWNGQGITSSAVATANATDAESRSVAYADNSALPLGSYTTFHGEPVDDTAVFIAFTRTADANLDGVVNDDDVTIVGASYAPGVPQPSWALGDFDYNGFVDDDDVTLLGAFYDPSAPSLAVSPIELADAVAAVSEPGTVTFAALAGLFFVAAASSRRCGRNSRSGSA